MSVTDPTDVLTSEVNFFTCGEFQTEPESAAAFDELCERSGLFHVYREVPGGLLQPRLRCKGDGVRIDRILAPKPKLMDAGWTHGDIGVEVKCSGKKIGPVVAQALDYLRSAFFLPNGRSVVLDQIFLWPFSKAAGDIESVMTQHRIGGVWTSQWRPLAFKMSSTTILSWNADNTVFCKNCVFGRKVGSR